MADRDLPWVQASVALVQLILAWLLGANELFAGCLIARILSGPLSSGIVHVLDDFGVVRRNTGVSHCIFYFSMAMSSASLAATDLLMLVACPHILERISAGAWLAVDLYMAWRGREQFGVHLARSNAP